MTIRHLTPRQRQVAELVAMGLTRKEIARRLSPATGGPMSIRTVDVHVQTIAARLPHDDLPASRRVRKWMLSKETPPDYAGAYGDARKSL